MTKLQTVRMESLACVVIVKASAPMEFLQALEAWEKVTGQGPGQSVPFFEEEEIAWGTIDYQVRLRTATLNDSPVVNQNDWLVEIVSCIQPGEEKDPGEPFARALEDFLSEG